MGFYGLYLEGFDSEYRGISHRASRDRSPSANTRTHACADPCSRGPHGSRRSTWGCRRRAARSNPQTIHPCPSAATTPAAATRPTSRTGRMIAAFRAGRDHGRPCHASPRAAWPAPDEARSSTDTQSRDLDAVAGFKLSLLSFKRRGASRRCRCERIHPTIKIRKGRKSRKPRKN